MNQDQLLALRNAYELQQACERAGEALHIVALLTDAIESAGLEDQPLDDVRVGMVIASELAILRDNRQIQWLDALHEVRLQRAALWSMTSRRERTLTEGKLEATQAARLCEWRYEMAELYLINYEGELECETPIPTRAFIWEVEAYLPTAYLP